MLNLAAFADEISPRLEEQVAVCKQNGITHFELRTVDKINVLDFDSANRTRIRDYLKSNEVGVACIGSPIGKIKIDEPWEPHFEKFKYAVDSAEFFGAPLIRIFSYYAPEKGGDVQPYRDEVMKRMAAKVDYVKNRPVTLVHENESGIFGDRGAHCLDLMKTINSPRLRCAFDFANFVQVGEKPLDNWAALKPYTVHIHIKDAKLGGGKIVPPGEGDGQLEPILKDAYQSGYRGFLSMEPHLASHEQFFGFSGPDMFKLACDSLKDLCRRSSIPLAGIV